MYLKKEIIISFCIITISASNLYMPMIRLYVFLRYFLILFLCDPDLQCKNIWVIFFDRNESVNALTTGPYPLGSSDC